MATGEELAKFSGHTAGISTLAFSPDGEMFASGSQDMTIRLWETVTGNVLHILKRHINFVEAVAFAPDGKTLASGSWDKTIRLWDLSNGEPIDKFGGHTGGIKSVAFSPDGNVLASAGTDKTICLWGTKTRRRLRQIFAHEGVIFSVVFEPTGKVVASGSEDRNVILWDVVTGKEVRRLPPNQGLVSGVAFSPNGKHLAVVNTGFSTMMIRRPVGSSGLETSAVSGQARPTQQGVIDLEKFWTDLISDDSRTAYNVTRLLASMPEKAVPFLRGRLKPALPLDQQHLAWLVAQLFNEDPQIWQKARADMLALGRRAEKSLAGVVRSPIPGAGTQRLTDVLVFLSQAPPTAEELREMRAVSVLLKIKTPEARQVLEELARGAPDAVLTRESQTALKRF